MVTLVYLPGQTENGSAWEKVDGIVSRHGYKGIRINFNSSLRSIESHVKAVYDEIGNIDDKIVLVGASKGSMVAMHYCSSMPKNIEGLFLVSPRVNFNDHEKRNFVDRIVYLFEPLGNNNSRIDYGSDQYLNAGLGEKKLYIREHMGPTFYKRQIGQTKALVQWDVSDDVNDIIVPVRLVYGAGDNSLDHTIMENLPFNDAKSIIIPCANHFPHIEMYNDLSQELIRFLMKELKID